MSMNKKWVLILVIMCLFLPLNVFAAIGDEFCTETKETVRFLGFLLLFGKILVPFIIIFMGSLDYFKVVTGGKEDDMKKQTITLLKRILGGVTIFFIPTILNVTFTLINGWSDVASEYEVCATCLLEPTSCETD